MVLHHLYGQQQLADCLTLVGADDTVLIMDAGVLEVAGSALSTLPSVLLLLLVVLLLLPVRRKPPGKSTGKLSTSS